MGTLAAGIVAPSAATGAAGTNAASAATSPTGVAAGVAATASTKTGDNIFNRAVLVKFAVVLSL